MLKFNSCSTGHIYCFSGMSTHFQVNQISYKILNLSLNRVLEEVLMPLQSMLQSHNEFQDI